MGQKWNNERKGALGATVGSVGMNNAELSSAFAAGVGRGSTLYEEPLASSYWPATEIPASDVRALVAAIHAVQRGEH